MSNRAQSAQATGRAAAIARRRAMAEGGKAAIRRGQDAGRPAPAAASDSAARTTKASGSRAPASGGVSSQGGGSASGRDAARARRRAMAASGKAGLNRTDRQRGEPQSNPLSAGKPAAKDETSACGCGCKEAPGSQAQGGEEGESAGRRGDTGRSNGRNRRSRPQPRRGQPGTSQGRKLAMARRSALAERGKAGADAQNATTSPAAVARRLEPRLSGRELAQRVREQRSREGGRGTPKSAPCGRQRKAQQGAAQDAPWKVGVSETSHSHAVTGTQVNRSDDVTGNEAGTCREVTGTEYMGAEVFQAFCDTRPRPAPTKVGQSATSHGRGVTGSEVGRSERVTGDEPGSCQRITGTEYVGAEKLEAFCGVSPEPEPDKTHVWATRGGQTVTGVEVGQSPRVTGHEAGAGRQTTGTQYVQPAAAEAPSKVGTTQTYHGGSVTGTLVGRGRAVTGDEAGTCQPVTGEEYVGKEQYQAYCGDGMPASDEKVGVSGTAHGQSVTGSMTGRSPLVTGDEPGTCKAVTGTPYAGAEQYSSYCEPAQKASAAARTRVMRQTPAAAITGQQPGLNGTVTGAERGACQGLTGTPYVGEDSYTQVCSAVAEPALPGSPDFPQMIGGDSWQGFSVSSPAREAQADRSPSHVTGTRYEQGRITGAFGRAEGKVTGTEQFRFGRSERSRQAAAPVEAQTSTDGQAARRVTGEGMDPGAAITGDDWDRGDAVTGTEGRSATRRNPTRRGGPMSAMPSTWGDKRNDETASPESRVTGSSGSTEQGALITVSGGARG